MVETLTIHVEDLVFILIVHTTDDFTTYYIDFLIEEEFGEGRVFVSCNL